MVAPRLLGPPFASGAALLPLPLFLLLYGEHYDARTYLISCEPNPSSPNLLSFALAVASPTGASAGFAALPAFCIGSVTTSPGDDVQRNPFWEVSPVDDAVVNLARGLEAVGELSSTPHHGHPLDLGIDLDRPSADSALNGDPDVGDVSTLFLEGFASIDATTLMSFGIELDGDALINISSTVLPVLRPPLDAGVDTRLVAQVRPATSLVSVFGPSGCVRVSVLVAPCGAAVLTTLMTSPGAFITSAFSRVLAADPYERRSRRLLRQLKELDLMSYVQRFKAGDVDDECLDSLGKPELYDLGLPVGPRARLAAALGLRPLSSWSLRFCRSPSAPAWARALAGYWSRRTANAESGPDDFDTLESLSTLGLVAVRSRSTSSAAFAANGLAAADATAAAGAPHNHEFPTYIELSQLSYRLLPALPASTVLFEKVTGASLLKHGAPYWRLSVETWSISRKWPRRRDAARAPVESKHVSRHAASLLMPQKHGLRGDGPSPDTSNHEASLSPKPPDKVAEDAGEHVSRDAASLLVPQEHGLRGDGPPSTTFTTGTNVPGPTRVDDAQQSLSVAIETIGHEAFAFETVTSALERLAVTYRDEELTELDPRSLDEMRVLCAAQGVELMKLLKHNPKEPLALDHIKRACGELHANDACLKELLRGLTHKIEREKSSPSTRRIHVQCLTTLNECFKHVPSWVVRRWFKLVTTEDHRTRVESFAELCTEDLCSNLDGVCASDPTLAERVTCATPPSAVGSRRSETSP